MGTYAWPSCLSPGPARAPRSWLCTRGPLIRYGFISSLSLLCLPTVYSFIHSGHFYSAPSNPQLLRGAPDYSTDTVSEFHAEAHNQLKVKDLAKVPTWRLARAGVEPTTLRLKVIVSTYCHHVVQPVPLPT